MTPEQVVASCATRIRNALEGGRSVEETKAVLSAEGWSGCTLSKAMAQVGVERALHDATQPKRAEK